MNNRRLAMSDELAQDEEDAEDYDLEALEHRTRAREEDDDDATLVGRRGPDSIAEDHVVFEIGDEDDEDPETPSKKRRGGQEDNPDHHEGSADERAGLIGRNRDD